MFRYQLLVWPRSRNYWPLAVVGESVPHPRKWNGRACCFAIWRSKLLDVTAEQPHELDDALRALAHGSRRAILRLTANRAIPATELSQQLDVAPATASEHLRVLRKTGLVELSVSGTWRLYQAAPSRLEAVIAALIQDLRLNDEESRRDRSPRSL